MAGRRARSARRADLSQHFLRSKALAASLVADTTISRDDLVVEIGAGRGVLTAALARRCARVVAVELDERLCVQLRRLFHEEPRVAVVHADALRFELPDRRYKVLGNIPYNRTADIVRRVTGAPRAPEDAYLVMQLEAARRFAGWPFGVESLASLLLKPWWHVEIVRRLGRSDFDPPPKVESAVLWLALRPRPLVEEGEAGRFRGWIRDAFGVRGRSVARCLKGSITRRQLGRLARELHFDPDAAPSALCFGQWLAIYRTWRRLS